MSNVVLGYPAISQTDYEWIQQIRKTEDRLYEAVRPHFTFVFPTSKLTVKELARHTEVKVGGFAAIPIRLTKAIVVEDDSRSFFHTFLVPTDGAREITALHDGLYTDGLASELRLDIPYIPHVGIATNQDEDLMHALADRVNRDGVDISGKIEVLTVASYDGKKVMDEHTVVLAGGEQ